MVSGEVEARCALDGFLNLNPILEAHDLNYASIKILVVEVLDERQSRRDVLDERRR